MLTVLSILAFAVTAHAAPELPQPKTLMDLELDKIEAYHGLKSYRQEMETKVTTNNAAPETITTSTYIDGPKLHTILTGPDGSKGDYICDGTKSWWIYPPQMMYLETPLDPTTKFSAQQNLLKTKAYTYQYSVELGRPVRFAIDPYPTLLSNSIVKSGSDTLRRIVFISHTDAGLSTTLTQWFLPDRWILKRFDFTANDKEHSLEIAGEATTLDFDSVAPSNEYVLDPSLVNGLTKHTPEKPADYTHPTSFRDFELAKIVAHHELDQIHEEINGSLVSGSHSIACSEYLYKDGEKCHSHVVEGGYTAEVVCDGVKSWSTFPMKKVYIETLDDPLLSFDPNDEVIKRDDGGFNFAVNSSDGVLFAFMPEPTLEGITTVKEGDTKYRKVVFGMTGKKGRHVTLTQWFQEDKWLLKRFLAEIEDESGKSTLKGEVKLMKLTDQDRATRFVLDPALIKGLQLFHGNPDKKIGG